MIGLFWNVRGLNGPQKISKVQEIIRSHCPDFICLSETKKAEFSINQLEALDSRHGFIWNWLPANNTAGGLLVGVKEDKFEILACDIFTFSISCLLKNKCNSTIWRLISVYGSAYDNFKLDFINELHNLLNNWAGPTIVGGDFNLVRAAEDKNTGLVIQHWANLFNDWINKFGLIEIKNAGRKYNWANN